MNPLSIAATKVDAAGDPYAACQKLTKSDTESKRIAADAALTVSSDAMDKLSKSTIQRPDRKSRQPVKTTSSLEFNTFTH